MAPDSKDTDAKRGYRPIGDYGCIGDQRTVALVARDGSIDWCCWPRFDAPPVFGRLLDARRGDGFFQICPATDFEAERRYIDGTNVLETTFRTASGVARLTDAMPLPDGEVTPRQPGERPSCLLRRVEVLEGQVRLRVVVSPWFDWGRQRPRWTRRPWGFGCGPDGEERALAVWDPQGIVEVGGERAERVEGQRTMRAGEIAWFGAAAVAEEERPHPLFSEDEARAALETTTEAWRRWSAASTYDGPHADLVGRSALFLAVSVYAPSGAVVAAPTTSLPESVGGTRNWDYRYTWLRDSGLLLHGLQSLGYHDEAMGFWRWLESLDLSDEETVQNLFRIDGRRDVPEQLLEHLEGYRGSAPVRTGNGGVDQVQLDRYGAVVDAAYLCQTRMGYEHDGLQSPLRHLADQAARRWREPDSGIWEMRGEPLHFVHSALMCWVALDRAVRLHERAWLDGDDETWRRERAAVRRAILERGWDEQMGAFTQAFDRRALDASVLAIPLVGFLPADDPRVVSTRERIVEELQEDGLVYRYRVDDGLPGEEGYFAMCSFWLVSNYAMAGEMARARELFDEVVGHCNDLGLLSEEIGADGELLGNFPQAFSHLSLIQAALLLREPAGHGPDERG